MWTYRPADSTPTPREKKLQDPAPYSAARLQPSSAPFQTQNGAAPHRQSAFGQEQHTTGAVQSGRRPESMPRTVYETSDVPTAHKARIVTQSRPSRTLRTACVMGCLYLAGLAAGSLCSRMLSEPLLTYARYFASIDLGLRTAGNAAMVFSVGFLSLFCQLSLVLIAGFCVLGIGLIPITMVLKGAGAGIFTALLYQQLGAAKGLVLQALVFWLPETLGSLLVILLSAFALHVSCGLLRCCLGQGGSGLGAASRCLIHRYLTICFVSMLVCGLSVLLTLVFGGLF